MVQQPQLFFFFHVWFGMCDRRICEERAKSNREKYRNKKNVKHCILLNQVPNNQYCVFFATISTRMRSTTTGTVRHVEPPNGKLNVVFSGDRKY
jgi:hypothetical protein